MATAGNAEIKIETNQTYHAPTAMVDSGDQKIFNVSGGTVWSGKSGFAPVVTPNGVASGYNLVTPHASNDTLTIAGCTCYLAGVLVTVPADATQTITRPATNVSKINSVIITSAGAFDVLVGTDGSTTAFSTTRGAAGGPPYITVGAIEVAQIKVTTSAAAAITSAQIFQNGDYTERYDFPTWDTNNIGDGNAASVAAQKNAYVKFNTALPKPHTGDLPKGVYIQYYTPEGSELAKALDFKPVENSQSVSSTQVYGNKTVGSRSMSIGTGGFTALLNDGISDALVADKDEILTVWFYPDRDKAAYALTQGSLSLTRSFPVANQIQAAVTIASDVVTAEFNS